MWNSGLFRVQHIIEPFHCRTHHRVAIPVVYDCRVRDKEQQSVPNQIERYLCDNKIGIRQKVPQNIICQSIIALIWFEICPFGSFLNIKLFGWRSPWQRASEPKNSRSIIWLFINRSDKYFWENMGISFIYNAIFGLNLTI